MDRLHRERHHFQIMRAALAGDTEALRQLITAGILRRGNISHPWEILLAAIMSRSLEALQMVLTCYEPVPPPGRPYAPAIYACCDQSPLEMIICLMEHFTQPAIMTTLEYACISDDVKLAKALLAYETNRNPSCSKLLTAPLIAVAKYTANLELLQLLLNAYKNAGGTHFTFKKHLEIIAQSSFLEVEKKIDCFKILFNGLHPHATSTVPERYYVNDIARLAAYSMESTSLVPYFIETELMWETRTSISSLYKRLLPKYEMLALLVLCECGSATVKRKRLSRKLDGMDSPIKDPLFKELKELYVKAIQPAGQAEACSTEALQLLERMATFTKTINMNYFKWKLPSAMADIFFKTTINRSHLYQPSFHRAIEALVSMLRLCSPSFIELYIFDIDTQPSVAFSLLKHYPYQIMRPDFHRTRNTYRESSDYDLSKIQLLPWFLHLFGSWETIRRHVGKPVLELFTLKRFASDAIRKAVFQGIHNGEGAQLLFLNRIQSLNLPKEMIDYLRYCDRGTVKYFLEHLDADKRLKEADEGEALQSSDEEF